MAIPFTQSSINKLNVLLLVLTITLFLNLKFVHAKEINIGNISVDADTTLRYEAAWRVESPDSELALEANENFDHSGEMINCKFSALMDIDLNYENLGFFIRPRAWYDFAYDESKFSHDTQDIHRNEIEVLDSFFYGNFTPGNNYITFRVGEQVISWGESLFISNSISSAQSAMDLNFATSPDAELEDLFLPNGQVLGKIELAGGLSISGYYAYDWQKSRIPERGSYWNFSDLLDDAGSDIPVGGGLDIDRVPDNRPKSDSQWGVAIRYLSPELNATEFGLYVINYHEKLPQFVFNSGGGTYDVNLNYLNQIDPSGQLAYIDQTSYNLYYPEDIMLYGFSVSAAIGDYWNVSGEMSYRVNIPVVIKSRDPSNLLGLSLTNADMFQTQVSFMRLIRGRYFCDQYTFAGEVGINDVSSYGGESLEGDSTSWGFVLQISPTYYQIYPGLDLTIPITYKGNPNGTTPIGVAAPFVEHSDSVGIKLDFTYKTVYKLNIGYTNFFGGASNNSFDDRDNISLSLSYTF